MPAWLTGLVRAWKDFAREIDKGNAIRFGLEVPASPRRTPHGALMPFPTPPPSTHVQHPQETISGPGTVLSSHGRRGQQLGRTRPYRPPTLEKSRRN